MMNSRASHVGYKETLFHKYHKEYNRYLRLFGKERYLSESNSMSVRFGSLKNGMIGVCYYLFNEIEIDRKYWNEATLAGKEELFFHEMSHCVLKKDHTDPVSIMQSHGVIREEYYIMNYSKLINQLFDCQTIDCHAIIWDEGKYK